MLCLRFGMFSGMTDDGQAIDCGCEHERSDLSSVHKRSDRLAANKKTISVEMETKWIIE